LILVLLLVVLGGVNQLWLLRVNSIRADGEDGSALAVTLPHFRGVVTAEAVIGLVVLRVVPFLSGSARKQDFERHTADLTQTALAGGQEVRLRPSGAQPGPDRLRHLGTRRRRQRRRRLLAGDGGGQRIDAWAGAGHGRIDLTLVHFRAPGRPQLHEGSLSVRPLGGLWAPWRYN
jgi:hypothetical protein